MDMTVTMSLDIIRLNLSHGSNLMNLAWCNMLWWMLKKNPLLGQQIMLISNWFMLLMRWNGCTGKWCYCKVVGPWWWTSSQEERCGPRASCEWCDYIIKWLVGRGWWDTWIRKKPWWLLDQQALCETGNRDCNSIFKKSWIWQNNLQLKNKLIPAFERAHGAGHQALFLIDNSQGHSAYGKNALLISHMNIKPGGKQAQMHDGWFIWDGTTVSQPMIYPIDHPDHPDTLKGVKAIPTEHCLWQPKLHGKCVKACKSDNDTCCNKCILEWQPDFAEQKSLV